MKRIQKALENEGLTSFQDCSELFSPQRDTEGRKDFSLVLNYTDKNSVRLRVTL